MADENGDTEAFEALLTYLKESRGVDFTGYKRPSLGRRVNRRLQQLSVSTYADYLDYLQVHPEEFAGLFNTVLINVTGFFRDAGSWQQLRTELLPALLAAKKPTEPVRVWCAGVASGEEAYTVAMLLAEELGTEQFQERVKIYATDIDDDALNTARHAAYEESDVRDVPEDLLGTYFERAGQRYVFRKDLRRAVIFGRNDLVQDAPISRVDLLVCRNTLMYLNAETQAQVLARFNFALTEGGLMFLGKAEMLLSHAELFTPVDLKRRFFRKVPRSTPGMHVIGHPGGNGAASEQPERLEDEALLASPVATLVLTGQDQIAMANQRTETLFGVSGRDIGRPFRDLDVSYRPTELRVPLEEVRRERRATWVRDVEWQRCAGETMYLDIQLVPLLRSDGTELATALFFVDVTRTRNLSDELDAAHRQVETAYEELQSTVEELETTNEELQSTVEELETTNEELQSTNEELETMNEEMQSTNDELQSINDELRDRTAELDESNAFLESILSSLRSGVVVVDRELVVRVWNRRCQDLWGLRAEEVTGHHLLNLDIGMPVERLRQPIKLALADSDGPAELSVDAINRRGRAITLAVTCSPLVYQDTDPAGAIVLLDPFDGSGAGPGTT